MNDLILFVLKSMAISCIMFCWYILVLKNKRLHRYNRFFLLLTLYASIQLPLLHFNYLPQREQLPLLFTSAKMLLHVAEGPEVKQDSGQLMPASQLNGQLILQALTILISFILLVTMILNIVRLIRMAGQYPHTRFKGIILIQTDHSKAPFSFINRIYWRDSIPIDSPGGQLILQHELAHIRQKHSYDKLACQLLCCIFWMNPFYWWIQKELAMLHEFLADEQAIIHNNNTLPQEEHTAAFARMLLQLHCPAAYLQPEHQFFSSPIKRRLIMLQSNKTTTASLLRRIAVLPLLTGSIFLFSFGPAKGPGSPALKSEKKIILVVDPGHGGRDEGCHYGHLTEKELNLRVATRLQQMAPDYNIEVLLTRSADKDMNLDERVAFVNRLQPDAFISLHLDDRKGKEAGEGTFDIAVNHTQAKAEDSKRLAYAIYKYAARPEWEQKKALADKHVYVLKDNKAAAVLIELGDIKNKKQMEHIQDDNKLDELCSRILTGVVAAQNQQ